MSSHGSNNGEGLNTRFSTPAPELDDHRPRQLAIPDATSPIIPALEVSQPTPRPSDAGVEGADPSRVEEAIVSSPGVITARDFEQAISEKSEEEFDNPPGANRRGSLKPRQFTNNRQGRPLNLTPRHDQSRDSSSSRDSSPANSLEAFGEGRRQQRQRAHTINSRASSPDLKVRAPSHTTSRRPTLSQLSIPGNITQRTERDRAEEFSISDDEPGKTYKIDFEELEEFVALCDQGKIPFVFAHQSESESESNVASPKYFEDLRRTYTNKSHNNAALNGENFFEKHQLTNIDSRSSVKTTKTAAQRQYDEWKNVERFTFFSPEMSKGLHSKSLGGLVNKDTTFRDLFDVAEEGGVWWLDVVNPTKAELDVISKAFKIHRLTREDIETQEPREKVELFAQYYFVCFRSFNMNKKSEDFLDPLHLYIVVCGDGVLSFSYTANPHAKNVRRRISKLGDFVSLGPDYICYAMIDDIVDSFQPIIHDAEQESENIEDQVFIAREDDFVALLKQIGECRKKVLNMMRLLGGKADVIKGFAKRCNEQYEMTPRGDIGLYLGDIQDHVVTMMSNLGHVEKMLSRSHANYLAQLNVDSIIKGNSTNKALARVTVVATILVPLNLVTGLFGMNVHVPWMDGSTLYPFFGILGSIALFVCICLCAARRWRFI